MNTQVWVIIGSLVTGLLGGSGLTVWIVKAYMQRSAEKSAAEMEIIKNQYHADQEGVKVLTERINHLNDQVKWLTEENRKLADMHLDKVEKLSETMIAVGEKDARSKSLETQIDALKRENEIIMRENQLLREEDERKGKRIVELEKTLDKTNKELAQLRSRIVALEKVDSGKS